MDEFPVESGTDGGKRTIPFLPGMFWWYKLYHSGKKTFGRSHTYQVALSRSKLLEEYLKVWNKRQVFISDNVIGSDRTSSKDIKVFNNIIVFWSQPTGCKSAHCWRAHLFLWWSTYALLFIFHLISFSIEVHCCCCCSAIWPRSNFLSCRQNCGSSGTKWIW